MKTLLLVLSTVFLCQANAQTPSLDKFFKRHHQTEDVNQISFGGFALTFASWFIDDPATKNIAKKADRARFLITEGENRVTDSNVQQLLKQLNRDDFESLLNIRDGKDHVEIFMREDSRHILNVVAVVRSADEFLLASFECKLNKEDLGTLINQSL